MKQISEANLANLSNYSYRRDLFYKFGDYDSVEHNGKTYKGLLFGDSDCFSGNDFYQWMHTVDGKLLQMFFEIRDAEGNYDCDLDCVDYSKAAAVKLLVPADTLGEHDAIDLMLDIDSVVWM